MVAEATRGVKFIITTELDSGAIKPFEAMQQQVEALQKRTAGITIPAPKIAAGGASGFQPPSSPTHAVAAASDKLARERERAAERGFMAEAKWNRMAEAAVAKRAATEKREIDKLTADRKKALDQQMADDQKFWDTAAKQAQSAKQNREREEEKNRKTLATQFKTETKADSDFWKDFEKYGAKSGADRRKAESAEKKKAESAAAKAIAEHAEAQAKLRAGIDASINSVSQLTRGFAQLGLIGETDLHKITDKLLLVQGTIDTVRGGIDSFRSIRGGLSAMKSLQAAGGAANVLRTGATVAGLAAPGTAALGAGGLGTAGAAATAATAAPVGLIAAAGASIAAALASAGLTIRETMRYGLGGGAHVGGIVDRIATAEVGIGSSVVGAGLSAVGGIYDATTSPYGLTNRERARRTEGFLGGIVGSRAFQSRDPFEFGKTALANMRTERLQKEFEQDQARRAQFDIGHASAFEEQYGRANQLADIHEARRARERMLANNFSPLTREGPLLAGQNRERADLQARRAELEFLQQRVARERAEKLQPGALARGSQFDETSKRQIVEYEKQIRDLMTKEAQLAREIQQTAIAGLKQQLDLRKGLTATAEGKFKNSFEEQQGLEERVGGMLPSKFKAVLRAREIAEKDPANLTFEQINLLKTEGDARGRFLAGDAMRRIGRQRIQESGGDFGEVERKKYMAGMNSASAARNRQDELNREILGREKEAGIGRQPPVQVDATFQTELKLQLDAARGYLADLNQKFSEEVLPQVETAFSEQIDHFGEQITQRVLQRLADQERRRNQQGRQSAGG